MRVCRKLLGNTALQEAHHIIGNGFVVACATANDVYTYPGRVGSETSH